MVPGCEERGRSRCLGDSQVSGLGDWVAQVCLGRKKRWNEEKEDRNGIKSTQIGLEKIGRTFPLSTVEKR